MKRTINKYFCDVCGEETKYNKIFYFRLGFGQSECSRYYYREVCNKCLKDIVIPTIQTLGIAKELEFKQVGPLEQGGMQCPICKYLNNSYTFKGKCANCGFEKQGSDKE